MPISNQSSWDPIEKFGLASLIRLTAGNEHRIGLRERVALFICSLSLSLSLSLALCHQSFFFLALSTHQANLNRNDRRIWSECLSGAKTEKDKKKDWFLLFDSFFFACGGCLRIYSLQPDVLRTPRRHLPAEFGAPAAVGQQRRPAVAVLAQLHRPGRSPRRPRSGEHTPLSLSLSSLPNLTQLKLT